MKYKHTDFYALPGGFVGYNEDLNSAVQRGLYERTGLDEVFLKQFYTFGSANRYEPQIMKQILTVNALDQNDYAWLLDRFVSVAYYALIDISKAHLKPDFLTDECSWYDLHSMPHLMQDHGEMVAKALLQLRQSLHFEPVVQHLLPERFTMKALQVAHETILGEKLHRGSFQRKMLASGLLVRHEKQFTGAANKAPYLYSFRP